MRNTIGDSHAWEKMQSADIFKYYVENNTLKHRVWNF